MHCLSRRFVSFVSSHLAPVMQFRVGLISRPGARPSRLFDFGQPIKIAQHLDGAEAILSGNATPNFGLRKPGYTLILAGLGALTGNMSWSAIAANYAFLAFLPVAAYGIGFSLRGRSAGWLAALLTMAHLQTALWAGRIMSEASYTCFATFGILLVAIGLSRPRMGRWMFAAGTLLAGAWLIRSVALSVIVAALVCICFGLRRSPRRAVATCALLLLPVIGAVALECGLNYQTAGRFRTSTSALGIMLQTRARYLQRSPFPDTETNRWFLDLLPERSPEDAYRANKLDGCIARCRAIRGGGMDEWEFNARITRSGLETLAADPMNTLTTGLVVFFRHLFRYSGGPSASRVAVDRRSPIIVHEAAIDFQDSQDNWFAYWILPHRSLKESTESVARMWVAADERAPFGGSDIWRVIRYAASLPVVVEVLNILRAVGSLWPGFALILCGLLGLNRRICALLALSYVLDAVIIGICGSTDIANHRYQFIWLATDAALVACLVTRAVEAAAGCLAGLVRVFRPTDPHLVQ